MKKRTQAAIKQPSAATVRLQGQAAIKEPSALTRRLTGQAAIKSRSATTGGLRAQAAMEFLMTYGWAILIMLVVIALLFFLGVFNSGTSVPSSCVLPSGFTCAEFSLDSSGRLFLDLGQATGKTITVTGVGCGPAGSSVTNLSLPVTVQTGSHAVVSDSDITCSGNYSGAFKGKISIRYQPAGAAYNKTIMGDLSAPVAVVSAGEQDQWNSSYSYYRQVTVNTGVSSNLTDFPAYFVLDTQHLIAYGRMNSSCKDLRVVNSTKDGVMDYEIENNTCNTTNTVVWFRIPQTNAANDYTAYAFYGNNSASDAQNKPGVWQNGFVAVYHLSDFTESVSGYNITSSFNVTQGSGRIGNAYLFGGYSGYLALTAFPLSGDTVTLSAWTKSVRSTVTQTLLADASQSGVNGYIYTYRAVNSNDWTYQYANGSTHVHIPANSLYSGFDSQFIHQAVCVNYTTRTMAFFRNGASYYNYSASDPMIFPSTSRVRYIGSYQTGGAGEYRWNGTIDELRIAGVPRTADWFLAEYGQTYSVGSETVN